MISEILHSALQNEADLTFLALVIWREARGQSEECKRGVAYSILNRVQRPSWWGKDISSVVFARLQYSSMTYAKDPQLTTWPANSKDPSWIECLNVANEAISSISDNPVPGADSYHDISIAAPKWADPKMFVKQLGRIRFFDTDHDHQAGMS